MITLKRVCTCMYYRRLGAARVFGYPPYTPAVQCRACTLVPLPRRTPTSAYEITTHRLPNNPSPERVSHNVPTHTARTPAPRFNPIATRVAASLARVTRTS